MSKKLPVEEKPEKEKKTLEELSREVAKEEIMKKLNIDGFLRDYIGEELEVVDVESAERGVIFIVIQANTNKKLRLWTNSSIALKKLPVIYKALNKYTVIIKPQLRQSKNGNTYLVI
jgi:hypothetical protein